MKINHNIQALNAYRNLNNTTNMTSKSLEKLSSGLRINRASDDAAGLAISEKMRSQIRGLDMAERNSLDAISLIQTAEGALASTHDILQRMRELSVQAANGTLEQTDRQAIQDELNQLTGEINRISDTTQFNQKKLLNGSEPVLFAEVTSSHVAYKEKGVFAGTAKAAPTEPAKLDITFPIEFGELSDKHVDGKYLEINGKVYELDNDGIYGEISVPRDRPRPRVLPDNEQVARINGSVEAIAETIRANDPSLNITFTPAQELDKQNNRIIQPAVLTVATASSVTASAAQEITVASDLPVTFTNPYDGTATTYLAAPETASVAETVEITFAKAPSAGDYLKVDGLTIFFGSPAVSYEPCATSVTIDPAGKSLETVLQELTGVLTAAITDPLSQAPGLDQASTIGKTLLLGTFSVETGMAVEVKDSSYAEGTKEELAMHFQIGANESENFSLALQLMDAKTLGISELENKGLSVLTAEEAALAITAYDNAIRIVSAERSKLGAVQNRLEHTISNLQIANENLTAAESRIRDLDMAKEMTQFTKNNILTQAGQAMLAQSNQLPQGILQLLQ